MQAYVYVRSITSRVPYKKNKIKNGEKALGNIEFSM